MHFRFSTGLRCNPKNFAKQTILGREPNSEPKNASLKRMKEAIELIFQNGMNLGKLPSPSDFKEIIKSEMSNVGTARGTLEYLDDYVLSLRAKKKSRSFISSIQNLKALLIKLQLDGISIRFDAIDLNFETKFRTALDGFATNTVSAYIKKLKIFLNWAMRNNLHTNLIYKQFEMKQEAREIIALTELEIDRINKLSIPTHRHIPQGGTRLIRDWLIISTQTGVRFSDFGKVSMAELIPVENGYNIKLISQKTKTKIVVPVSKLLYAKLKEYDFAIPKPPSNQKYNAGLTRIASLANLTKKISSHTGRKTFCTIQYLKGTPVPNIMKMSGHKTEKEFFKYVGVSLTENAALVRNANADFVIEHEAKLVVNR